MPNAVGVIPKDWVMVMLQLRFKKKLLELKRQEKGKWLPAEPGHLIGSKEAAVISFPIDDMGVNADGYTRDYGAGGSHLDFF